jgi:SAM-dependent methyltransferase
MVAPVVPVEGLDAELVRPAPERVKAVVAWPYLSDPPSVERTLGVMANEQMREQWTTHGGPAWSANRNIFESVYAPVMGRLLDTLGAVAGMTVLDIGCGTGGLCGAITRRGGSAVGVDISETMIAAARELHPSARFEVADAQSDDLVRLAPAGFDRVASEFGVMFFDDPVAAFANIAAAVKPDGAMAFVCWRSLRENPTFTLGTSVLAERMPEPPPAPAPARPGPTAFADHDYLAGVLAEAGWSDIAIEPFDTTLHYGIDGSDGVEERMAIIQSGMTGRLAEQQLRPALGESGWAALLDEVRADVRRSLVDGSVAFPGAFWVVTAARR